MIALPCRGVPEPVHTERMDEAEIIMLAHMIGDGSCVKRQPIRYASIDEANLVAVAGAAKHFVTAARRISAARVTTLMPAPYWLTHGSGTPSRLGSTSWGCSASGVTRSSFPKRFSRCPTIKWRCSCGTCGRRMVRCAGDEKVLRRVYYATTSRQLADDVVQLLLRVVGCSRDQAAKKGYRDCWHVLISTAPPTSVGS